jgi:hypothetical protein
MERGTGTTHADEVAVLHLAQMDGRLTVRRATVQDWLNDPASVDDAQFDLVYAKYTLHHVFETREQLSRSPLYADACELFRALRARCTADAELIIFEQARWHTFRLAQALGLTRRSINYATKQGWHEWDQALGASGWRRESLRPYLPYGLRALSRWEQIINNRLGRFVLSQAYVARYMTIPSATSAAVEGKWKVKRG